MNFANASHKFANASHKKEKKDASSDKSFFFWLASDNGGFGKGTLTDIPPSAVANEK